MNTLRNKIAAITISIFFILSISASMTLLPSASAHSPPWTIKDHAFINAQPSPIGVGQTVTIIIWTAQPLPNAALTNAIRKENYTLTITGPDGTVVATQHWDVIPNPGGEQAYEFTPAAVGNYQATFVFGGTIYPALSQVNSSVPLTQAVIASINADAGDIYTPQTASVNFTAQQQPLSTLFTPLPTAYWTRPIEGENYNWYAVASNWLGGNTGGFGGNTLEAQSAPGMNVYQPGGSAPTSGHILWTQPEEFGGVVGATDTANLGATFFSGDSYEPRFTGAIIMDGFLYFKQPLNHAGTSGNYVCEDLKTGAVVWKNTDPSFDPTWGQIIAYSDPNQAGAPGGYLFQAVGSTWLAYDAFTGIPVFNITNVPSGEMAMDSIGSMLIYVMNYNTTSQTGWLALWNSTKLIQDIYSSSGDWHVDGQVFNGNGNYFVNGGTTPATSGSLTPFISPYTWNVTINADLDGLGLYTAGFGPGVPSLIGEGVHVTGPSMNAVVPDDILFGTSSGLGQATGNQFTPNPFTMWAINLNSSKGQIGQVLWVKNYTAPDIMTGNPNLGSFTERFATLDPINRVVIFAIDETGQFIGYSATTGDQLWQTNFTYANQAQAFSAASGSGMRPVNAYGHLYVAGYGGEVFCFDTTNGNLLWQFGNGGEGNTTENGINSPWGLLPTNINVIADGELIASSFEHGNGALSPYYRGERIWALNATTGEQIWTILFQTPNDGGPGFPEGALADGQFVEYNYYDNQVYDFGQGPSQTTVNAPDIGVTTATPITITGTVMDVSAGTKQNQQAADFPNGVPCASDASESEWMEYVYMQKAEPTNFTGVPVTLYVLDSNNNYRSIGTTTTNAYGEYSYTWTPDIAGNYTVTAVFAGSNAYYGSSDSIGFYASQAATASPAPQEAPSSNTDMYVIGIGVAIIVILVIIGALIMLTLRRQPKP